MTARCAALLTVGVLAFAMGGCAVADTSGPVASTSTPDPAAPSALSPSPSTGVDAPGDAATWTLVDPAAISAAITDVRVAVTRLGCSSGKTGELRVPRVSYDADEVVIEVDAEPLGAGAFECPGNDAVEVVVTLTEALGDRSLVDGACLEGEAVSTAACADGPVRWP